MEARGSRLFTTRTGSDPAPQSGYSIRRVARRVGFLGDRPGGAMHNVQALYAQ